MKRIKIKLFIKVWLRRLDQRIPVRARCGHWARKGKAERGLDLLDGWMSMCPRCYAREQRWKQ